MSRIGRGRCSAQNQEMVKFTPQTEDWPPLSGAGGGQGYQGFRRYTAIISSPEKCLLGSRRPHAQIILQSTDVYSLHSSSIGRIFLQSLSGIG